MLIKSLQLGQLASTPSSSSAKLNDSKAAARTRNLARSTGAIGGQGAIMIRSNTFV